VSRVGSGGGSSDEHSCIPRFALRFDKLPVYPVAHVPLKKRELLAKGVDVIDLGAGDADLAPPDAVLDRMARAIREPAFWRYGFGLGHMPFREAIVAWMQQRFGQRFDPVTEIVPLIGSKEGITNLTLAVLQRGDVAIIPEPAYLAYIGGTLLAEAEPYYYPLRPRTNFLLELDDVPADVLRRTRLLFLNYPNNPTTAIAPRKYLERIVRRCRELNILLVYDNAYSEFGYDGYVAPSIFEIDGAREVAVELHSLSKTYNMTGWRIGWAVARPEIAGALSKVKSFIDTGSFMAIQAAGVAALESWADFVPPNMAQFRERRNAAVSAFRAAGFNIDVPPASMYLWIPLPGGIPSRTFTDRLADDEGVIAIAGSSFGMGGEGYFRVSFVTSPQRLSEAAQRSGRVLSSITSTVGA
jgi:LL-diaminopimelate aminotransferase